MRKRTLCPNPAHSERTPSFVIYDDYGHCFGCGYRAPLKELGIGYEKESKETPIEKEDVEKTLDYINKLPTKAIRGLDLPYDDRFYYVVFPGYNYYKKRAFADSGSKYLCPTGHAKPLYVPYKIDKADTLAIVEGELNALSLATTKPPFDVCSPGGCSSFYGKEYERYKQFYLHYKQFFVMVDKDSAGVRAAIELKAKLTKHSPYVMVRLMDRDLNEILIENGTEGVRKAMGLSTRM